MYGGLHTMRCGRSASSISVVLVDHRSAHSKHARSESPRNDAFSVAVVAAPASISNPSSALFRSILRRCSPTSPLPDVSSAILVRSVPFREAGPRDLAWDKAASDAHWHSSVSSGEKNDVNRNGGRNARSRPASAMRDGSSRDGGTGLPNRYGTRDRFQIKERRMSCKA